MEAISKEKLNEIRTSVDIVEVIGKYIPLTPKGKNYFGVCPFHDDHTPSMSVSSEKQIYTCFVCHETGNVFNFIMKYENITFIEAVKKVADISHINLDIKINNKIYKTDNTLYDIYELSNKFYKNNINTKNGFEAKKYLNDRSISEDIIKEFEIGLSMKDNKLLTTLLINKKYSEIDIIKSGLVNKNNNGLNDTFYNRIMFPLHNLMGQVVGFSGRIYNMTDTSKYINSKETEIFKKGELLYNYYKAKDNVRKKNQVIITEGFMDVIRLYSIDIKNVVAVMGTAFTKNHALLIKRMAHEVILLFDGDLAGEKATLACANELIKIGVNPKIIRLENNLDPDEYIIKYGKDKFINKINNPTNIMDYKLSILKKQRDLTKKEDMALYINQMLDELSKINDEVLKELTLKKLSNESGLDIEFLRSKIAVEKIEEIKPIVKIKKISKYEKAEKNLIYYMLRDVEAIKIYQKKITYMPTTKYRYLAREISTYYKENGNIDIADFISYLDDEEMITTLGDIESLELNDKCSIEEIKDYIRVIKEYNVTNEVLKLQEQMKNATDSIEKANIGIKIVELKKNSMEDIKC